MDRQLNCLIRVVLVPYEPSCTGRTAGPPSQSDCNESELCYTDYGAFNSSGLSLCSVRFCAILFDFRRARGPVKRPTANREVGFRVRMADGAAPGPAPNAPAPGTRTWLTMGRSAGRWHRHVCMIRCGVVSRQRCIERNTMTQNRTHGAILSMQLHRNTHFRLNKNA